MKIRDEQQLNMIWISISQEISSSDSISSPAFNLWFSDIVLIEMDEKSIKLRVSNEETKRVLSDKYSDVILDAVDKLFNYRPEIDIFVKEQNKEKSTNTFPNNTENVYSNNGTIRLSYNANYTFDNFIVGKSNQFAHAAAIAVAKNPATEYNPLFIYGPSGLGKTHLLYAITNKMLEDNPDMNIAYIKGEDFMNNIVDSIRDKSTREFREKYRQVDVLLLDDIQFIAGKESIEGEFFHTFEALYEKHKQIVLTSDRSPNEIASLTERLKNRFQSGLMADIQPPDYELRLAILKQKTDDAHLNISNDVTDYLAERLSSNVRQIEGIVKKLGALAFLNGTDINLDTVKKTLPDFLSEDVPSHETVKKIILLTAKKYDVAINDIKGLKRTQNIKDARNLAMYLIREETDLSLQNIGKEFNRDYSTVISNIKQVQQKIDTDPAFSSEVEMIKSDLKY